MLRTKLGIEGPQEARPGTGWTSGTSLLKCELRFDLNRPCSFRSVVLDVQKVEAVKGSLQPSALISVLHYHKRSWEYKGDTSVARVSAVPDAVPFW